MVEVVDLTGDDEAEVEVLVQVKKKAVCSITPQKGCQVLVIVRNEDELLV
jgi:hypothetical protein